MALDTYFFIGLFALILASITDLKRREVPDWINFGLIFFGLSFALVNSLYFLDVSYLLRSAVGVFIAFLIAAFMFYSGQWGGGDAKMLMGLGALFGIGFTLNGIFSGTFFNLVVNIAIAGAFYGILWSFYLSIKNFRPLVEKIKELSSKRGYVIFRKIAIASSAVILFIALFFKSVTFSLALLAMTIIFTYYIFIYIKAIEEACMLKVQEPGKLTEGDWIAEDVRIGGRIMLRKDKVITDKDIKKIEDQKRKNNPQVRIHRSLLFIPYKTDKELSELRKKDILLTDIKRLGLKKDKKLDQEDIESIKVYLRKNLLHDTRVIRDIFLGKKELKTSPYALRKGDRLKEDIKEDEFLVSSSTDLGIERYQIEELKKLYKRKVIGKVMIKEGIPFIPSFLIAYLMTFFLPSVFELARYVMT